VKLLCISDTVMPQLESAANLRRRYNDIDVVVSCGDLPSVYLEFIVSILNVPLFYVRGNHDEHYSEKPPGGENLHKRILTYKDITFTGLEGSIQYNRGKIQYSEMEMFWMVANMGPKLTFHRLRKGRPVDVFITHSPVWGIHDLPDRPHNGFRAMKRYLQWYRPRYMLHGHVHTYDRRQTTRTKYLDTCIMNINPITVLEIEPE